MINPQHARAEKNTERRLGFNLCKLGSSPGRVVPGFRQTGAKVVLMADSHMLQFHENSSKHPKKITLLFFIKNIFLNPGWPSYCIRRYLNTQRCTWPPENLIFQVVTEMLPTESKSQRQIGPYIIALLQNYSFLCVLSFEKHFSPFFGVLIQMLYSYKVFVHTEI